MLHPDKRGIKVLRIVKRGHPDFGDKYECIIFLKIRNAKISPEMHNCNLSIVSPGTQLGGWGVGDWGGELMVEM